MKSDANLRFYFNLQNENDIFFNDKIFFHFSIYRRIKKRTAYFVSFMPIISEHFGKILIPSLFFNQNHQRMNEFRLSGIKFHFSFTLKVSFHSFFLSKQNIIISFRCRYSPVFRNKFPLIQRLRIENFYFFYPFHQIKT